MPQKRKSSISRTIISSLLIVIGIMLCTSSTIAAVDLYCRSDIDRWMPIYPDAELVETQASGFFRVRASGISQQVYHTTDKPNDVILWYRDHRYTLISAESDPNNGTPKIASTNERVVADPDGNGSLIYYYTECAYN